MAHWFFDDNDLELTKPKPPTYYSLNCECGVHATYGKDAPREYHVDYCPLYVTPPQPDKKDNSESDGYSY